MSKLFTSNSVILYPMGNFNRGGNSGGGRDFGGDRRSNFRGGDSRGGDRGDREMFSAVCASCGKTCQVPFRPTGSKPVYCSDCFRKNGPQDSGGGRDFGGDRRSSFRSDSRGSDRGDREMFDAVCDNCGDKCQIPFQPRGGKPVLCSKCFEEKGGDSRKNGGQSSEQLNAINAKLDKILEMLSPTSKAPKKESKKAEKSKVKEAELVIEEALPAVTEIAAVAEIPEVPMVVEETVAEELPTEEVPAKKSKKEETAE